MKLLPCAGCGAVVCRYAVQDSSPRELCHEMRNIHAMSRELSKVAPVYPGVKWMCFDRDGTPPHAE